MKERLTIVKSNQPRKRGKTDWSAVKKRSDQQVMAEARADPDAPPATKTALKQFHRVRPVRKVNVKKIREKVLGLTQSEFADYFGIRVRTLQQWEQGRSEPSTVAKNFLRVIEHEPRAVQRALK